MLCSSKNACHSTWTDWPTLKIPSEAKIKTNDTLLYCIDRKIQQPRFSPRRTTSHSSWSFTPANTVRRRRRRAETAFTVPVAVVDTAAAVSRTMPPPRPACALLGDRGGRRHGRYRPGVAPPRMAPLSRLPLLPVRSAALEGRVHAAVPVPRGEHGGPPARRRRHERSRRKPPRGASATR